MREDEDERECPHPDLARLTYTENDETITYCVVCGANLEREPPAEGGA